LDAPIVVKCDIDGNKTQVQDIYWDGYALYVIVNGEHYRTENRYSYNKE
jgi:hypothetical protein